MGCSGIVLLALGLFLATSIDALVIGLFLAMIKIDILYPSVVIGITTAGMSLIRYPTG